MKFLDPGDTSSLLPYPALADAIRNAAMALQGGSLQAPPRTVLPLPGEGGGTLLAMPAADDELTVTKLVTVHPENAARGLPTIQGEVVVMRTATGERLGILDGATVTARRTAALSLLAAREFAPRPDGPLLILGAGAQGRSHLEAFRAGLGVTEVFLVSRARERADALADHAQSLGMEAWILDDPAEALGRATLIVTATTSSEPVLPEEISEDIFVAAVGSFTPEAAEIPASLVARSTVVADTIEGAKEEAGDLILAEKAGAFRWKDATSLQEALTWTESPGGPVLFESVGHAAWDLAAAHTVFSN
ncbi:MAG: delta(1)-pyrroline-2-carboxylate reductase family protein [Rubrobacteraceae bacterium]